MFTGYPNETAEVKQEKNQHVLKTSVFIVTQRNNQQPGKETVRDENVFANVEIIMISFVNNIIITSLRWNLCLKEQRHEGHSLGKIGHFFYVCRS